MDCVVLATNKRFHSTRELWIVSRLSAKTAASGGKTNGTGKPAAKRASARKSA